MEPVTFGLSILPIEISFGSLKTWESLNSFGSLKSILSFDTQSTLTVKMIISTLFYMRVIEIMPKIVDRVTSRLTLENV